MTNTHSSRLVWAVVALVVTTAMWGSTFPVSKDLLTRIAVPDLLAWRFLAASLVLAVLNPVALVRAGWRTLALGGAIGMLYFGAQYLHFVGLQYVAPTVSAFLLSMYVVITPFIAGAMARRWPSRRTLVASLLAAMGVAAMSLQGFAVGWGELLSLMAAAVYAVHIMALSRWSKPETSYALAVSQLASMGVAFLLIAFDDGLQVPQSSDIAAVLYMALFAGGLGLLLQTWAQAHVPAAWAAIIMVLEPVWAAFFGVTFYDEQLTSRIIVGAGLIIAAMVLITSPVGPSSARFQRRSGKARGARGAQAYSAQKPPDGTDESPATTSS